MAPFADLILTNFPLPSLPRHFTHHVEGQSPLSNTPIVYSTLGAYLVTILGIQAYMKDKHPHKLTLIFQAHNIFLSAGSLVLFALMIEEVTPIWWRNGIFSALCAQESWTDVSSLCVPKFDQPHSPRNTPENGILLYDQLLFQVYRTSRHSFPRLKKEAT